MCSLEGHDCCILFELFFFISLETKLASFWTTRINIDVIEVDFLRYWVMKLKMKSFPADSFMQIPLESRLKIQDDSLKLITM